VSWIQGLCALHSSWSISWHSEELLKSFPENEQDQGLTNKKQRKFETGKHSPPFKKKKAKIFRQKVKAMSFKSQVTSLVGGS